MLDRTTTLELTRFANELVLSGDRIGSAYHDDDENRAQQWLAYCEDIDIGRSATTLPHQAFDALWPDEHLDDGESVLAYGARVEAELRRITGALLDCCEGRSTSPVAK
jgi:hypothetical protein